MIDRGKKIYNTSVVSTVPKPIIIMFTKRVIADEMKQPIPPRESNRSIELNKAHEIIENS